LANIREDGVVLYMKESKGGQYKKALSRLLEAGELFAQSGDELHRDGLIQRFEFTFELAWKAMKEHLESEGFSDIASPKSVLKKAFSVELIDSEDWLGMLEDRNRTSHIYEEETAAAISGRICTRYMALFGQLADKL
jgi:nucleotidyltransferase substrate binding protein (TIGR01987 family)